MGRLTLEPGETIFLFTDGVTEANNPAAELFSETRLEAVLQRAGGRSSAHVIKAVAAELRGFIATAQPWDDVTMLAVRRSNGVVDDPS